MDSANILLSPSSYYILNKDLIKKIGIEPTLILSELISFGESKSTNKKHKYFEIQLSQIINETNLTVVKIKKGINKLYKSQFVDVIIKNEDIIKVSINHENILVFLNINTSKNIVKKKKRKTTLKKETRFQKPNLKDLKKYFLTLGNIDESLIMYDYYESKGWKVGKAPMKCWKSATRNWIRRLNKQQTFPNHYDAKLEHELKSEPLSLSKYHNHLKKIGWQMIYSPSAGSTWKKIKK